MKKVLKGFALSLVTLAVGFGALALPFHLFGTLSHKGMQLLFIAEVAVYLTLGMAYLYAAQKKKERRIREKERTLRRRARFQKAQEEYYSLAA